ncbi:MAG: hypothetical protein R3E66_01955 [bacterium]
MKLAISIVLVSMLVACGGSSSNTQTDKQYVEAMARSTTMTRPSPTP